jgi:hypothetical protein
LELVFFLWVLWVQFGLWNSRWNYWLWKLKQHKFDEELNTETEELTITAE